MQNIVLRRFLLSEMKGNTILFGEKSIKIIEKNFFWEYKNFL